MSILTDSEIVHLLEAVPPLLTGFTKPDDWYAKDSLTQPASLDLHVGQISVPPKEEPKVGEIVDKRSEYTLHPGQAAVVETQEELNFPKNVAAFGFPPTSISDRAVLMTNPGHIDPGFRGKLTFTLINMGREPFFIAKGRSIATLLLVKLEREPSKDFTDRYGDRRASEISVFDLNRLGRDFLDLDERARKTAQAVVREADSRIGRREIWVPFVTALVAAALAFGGAWLQSNASANELKQRMTALENNAKIDIRLKEVEIKLETLLQDIHKPRDATTIQKNASKKH